MPDKLSIVLNGKQEWITRNLTIRQLLESKQINPHVVACELNLEIIKRARLSDVVLKENDELEIIQMIGGG